jgi:hypothetical protein
MSIGDDMSPNRKRVGSDPLKNQNGQTVAEQQTEAELTL